MPSPMLTVHDLAAVLKVDRSTVWRMARRGDLPTPVRFGRSAVLRWTEESIDRFIAETQTQKKREAVKK